MDTPSEEENHVNKHQRSPSCHEPACSEHRVLRRRGRAVEHTTALHPREVQLHRRLRSPDRRRLLQEDEHRTEHDVSTESLSRKPRVESRHDRADRGELEASALAVVRFYRPSVGRHGGQTHFTTEMVFFYLPQAIDRFSREMGKQFRTTSRSMRCLPYYPCLIFK